MNQPTEQQKAAILRLKTSIDSLVKRAVSVAFAKRADSLALMKMETDVLDKRAAEQGTIIKQLKPQPAPAKAYLKRIPR